MSYEEFHIPNYLLKTAFGEKLRQKLKITPIPIDGDTQIARLSALGILGNMPSKYAESGYDAELVEMLGRANTVASGSTSGDMNIDSDNLGRDRSEYDHRGSIHYNTNDAMDVDLLDDEGEEEYDFNKYDDLETNASSGRRSSRKNSKSFHSLASNSNKFKYPLPTRWLASGNSNLILSSNGADLKVEAINDIVGTTVSSKSYEFYSTKANSTIPVNCGIYYYEIKVQSVTSSSTPGSSDVSLGFINSSNSKPVTKVPGLEVGSYGFSGNDGRITANQSSVSKAYSEKFGLDDVIGCCVNFTKNIVFYTKNGVNLGNAFHDITTDLIPVIGLRAGNSITTNFGQESEFLFDISGYISSEKLIIQKKIFNSTTVEILESQHDAYEHDEDDERLNKYTDKEIPGLLQKLVGSYFEHLGYVDIAKVFKEEVLAEQISQNIPTVTLSVDESSLDSRQNIRKFVMSGEIQPAIDLTNRIFPTVLAGNEEILFKLECNRFIQLIKSDKIDQAMDYGQYLRLNFSNNAKFQNFLNDIFSLIAFENPNDSELGYLLHNDELVTLSDELNSEILKSLGKSSISKLESLLKHNTESLNFLNEQLHRDSLLINTKDFKLDFDGK